MNAVGRIFISRESNSSESFLSHATYPIIAFWNSQNQEDRIQAGSGMCVMYVYGSQRFTALVHSCVLLGPFALCLPERTAVQPKIGSEAS